MIKQVDREAYSRACLLASNRKIEVIVHHFWSPWAKDYQGQKTWEAVKHYHTQVKGWSDIGYDVGVWKDQLWLLRDCDSSGVHGHMNATGAHCLGHNTGSLGIVLAGNFDEESPGKWGYDTLVWAVAEFCRARHVVPGNVHFHREYADKTCPGTRMSLLGFQCDVAELLQVPGPKLGDDVVPSLPRYRVVVGSDSIDKCLPKVVDGTLWVLAEELCKHLARNVPETVATHDNGYAEGQKLVEALGLMLTYRRTAQGHRWYVTWPE